MEKSIFEQIGGTYHQEGEYLLPNLAIPKNIPIGIWGQHRKQYLKTQCEAIYTGLLLNGELDNYLAETDTQAEVMFFQLANQLKEQESITEQLKAENQMEWIGCMNNIRQRAEEIVNTESIYF